MVHTYASGHCASNVLGDAEQVGHRFRHDVLLGHFLGGHHGTVATLQRHRGDVLLGNSLEGVLWRGNENVRLDTMEPQVPGY